MERLTQVIDGSVIFPQKLVGVTLTPDNQIMHRMLNRLASYEETGLTPEEIKNLKTGGIPAHWGELFKAECDGRLVVLPAATVYELAWDGGENCDLICPVVIDGIARCDYCDHGKMIIVEQKCMQSHINRIGIDVFLTRNDAEAALKERGRGE